MRGLFLRIFAAFWIAMTLAGLGFALVVAAEPETSGRRNWREFVPDALRVHGEAAHRAHGTGEERRAEEDLRALSQRGEFDAYFIRDPLGARRVLGPVPVPRDVLVVALRAARERRNVERRYVAEDATVVAVPVEGDVIAARFSPQSRARFFLGGWSRLPFRLGAFFVAFGLVAYFMARYLTRSLAHLRGASQRIAEGDLDVRVSERLAGAPPEVRDLGADFDRMAERIAALLEGQERLLRDVSHELRSPLARMTLALELARKKMPGDATAELERLERDAERLGTLVGHILTLTRLADDAKLPEDEVDLVEIIAGVVHDAEFEASRLGCRVVFDLSPPVTLKAHGEAMRWAIENVVRNAISFAAEGTEVRVRIEVDAEKHVVRVVTRDDGPGIPEDALEAIFRPFFRVGTDRDRKSGGTGIGLAITARVAARHGGRAFATLPKSGGLEVTFELPCPPPASE